jgi:hypothetical protein
MIKQKIKASLIHLLLSIVLVTLIVSLIIFFWYPTEYIGLTNFKEISILIILIDLVLGPVLTFVVFNNNKKSLRMDLAIIATIQISALSYGALALYQTHPLYITYKSGSFALINANEVSPADSLFDEYNISKLSPPIIAFTKLPEDPQEQLDLMMAVDLKGEPDIDKRVKYYQPYSENLSEVLSNSLDSTKLFNDIEIKQQTDTFIKKYKDPSKYSFLPLKGTGIDGIIVLDKVSALPITTIKTNPWKYVKK